MGSAPDLEGELGDSAPMLQHHLPGNACALRLRARVVSLPVASQGSSQPLPVVPSRPCGHAPNHMDFITVVKYLARGDAGGLEGSADQICAAFFVRRFFSPLMPYAVLCGLGFAWRNVTCSLAISRAEFLHM